MTKKHIKNKVTLTDEQKEKEKEILRLVDIIGIKRSKEIVNYLAAQEERKRKSIN